MLKIGTAGLLLACGLTFGNAAEDGLASKLPFRTDRPRLLFNKDQLPAIQNRCEGPYAKDYKAMAAWAEEQAKHVLSVAFDEKVRATATWIYRNLPLAGPPPTARPPGPRRHPV